MRLRYTSEANEDLKRIMHHIAISSPDNAHRFLAQLELHCEKIANYPTALTTLPQFGKGIRRIIHGNYEAYYRICHDEMIVFLIVHGARDTQALHQLMIHRGVH